MSYRGYLSAALYGTHVRSGGIRSDCNFEMKHEIVFIALTLATIESDMWNTRNITTSAIGSTVAVLSTINSQLHTLASVIMIHIFTTRIHYDNCILIGPGILSLWLLTLGEREKPFAPFELEFHWGKNNSFFCSPFNLLSHYIIQSIVWDFGRRVCVFMANKACYKNH